MPAAKTTKKKSSTKMVPMSKANKLTVAIICALLVLVGVFLVYQSFAASVGSIK